MDGLQAAKGEKMAIIPHKLPVYRNIGDGTDLMPGSIRCPNPKGKIVAQFIGVKFFWEGEILGPLNPPPP